MIVGNREDMIEGRVWDSIEKDDLEKIETYLNPYYAESGVNLPLVDLSIFLIDSISSLAKIGCSSSSRKQLL